MMDFLHYCWTHGATTNPDHTSKTCSNKQADMSTPPPSPICKAATTSFAASLANAKWKKPEHRSATAAMDVEQPTKLVTMSQEPCREPSPTSAQWPVHAAVANAAAKDN
jgi:hypothetical protein